MKFLVSNMCDCRNDTLINFELIREGLMKCKHITELES